MRVVSCVKVESPHFFEKGMGCGKWYQFCIYSYFMVSL